MTTPLDALLQVQEHDNVIAQLEYRRAHLPARDEREAALAEAKKLLPQHRDITASRAAIEAAERRVDDEVALQRAKAQEVDTKLYSGSIVSPRELQALQADLESIRAHISKLEDDELEQMSLREDVERELEPVEGRLADLQREVQRADGAIADGEREVDGLLAEARAARADAAEGLDPALLADYEARAARSPGKGAARLVGNTCQACHLSIPAIEADRMRHDDSDQRWYCDNCGAILVVDKS
jgi:predicted  nucleic acid-binding Zn-ribbon protein